MEILAYGFDEKGTSAKFDGLEFCVAFHCGHPAFRLVFTSLF
jgi:hypothetical protein